MCTNIYYNTQQLAHLSKHFFDRIKEYNNYNILYKICDKAKNK